jgi:hypothetical protein
VVFWPCATADLVIDTSALPADLMRPLTGHFALDAVGRRIFVTSFARHHGIPGPPI